MRRCSGSSDISLCNNLRCKDRESCCRFIAKPVFMQSYIMIDEVTDKDKCEFFIDAEEK